MKLLNLQKINNDILNTISYFSFFAYSSTFDDIFTFLPVEVTKKQLQTHLDRLIRQNKLISNDSFLKDEPVKPILKAELKKIQGLLDRLDPHDNTYTHLKGMGFYLFGLKRYTLPQYSIFLKNSLLRQVISFNKIILMFRYIKALQRLPFVKFVGITGSASMGNCKISDDVDMCIITKKNCLFLARFCTILLAHLLRLRGKKDSICLNLFFDESDLLIPPHKQTSYIAHEVLQMKPIINKNQTFERFLRINRWIHSIYPNSLSHVSIRLPSLKQKQRIVLTLTRLLLLPLEQILKIIQLAIIRRNKTGLIVSSTQLWLFKRDFEKKIASKTK
ncbi:hypothetical protein A2334_00930 [Candidatus Roizmanbacteria bacterium RIFOXYB2_FULL_38_10]|uniref:Polymerase nucleotidyl transferase domain-containing protein n=1 Tax=Candidatus Roizmanbacteria bacterium RIFOXYD1_FULL_38_12 TaxID=1802093 RepID=A0A1F7L1K9_9BACT|nr:MAG: hypothetical protein A3K47_04225 [Candidatus Roizmanbacteria bacterium RIFOXYA2_FULL_38_14]OGK63963.1 MAG: hypothetical protein A3K27_04225 [Candidatus Roizmanbacteria bacterium RIFOXYA1_FULL_37_12]OGK65809.1 MAG: hypothetical protein A3K38_04225 [Candidatus Roizmanbacteria bacterium RIFOXYB1_FULL_40_23]OGK68917.1 MAG: hypothetical protein A2334_00930 [Candidatus Roizmanbacteria bacterium RIFOXYB2_FULL_38_10]OGK70214.1 MAG: hypothetical protein A3K21_04230 [Candidatus Roizmanbacteria ba